MFIGHFALALAGKKVAPKTSLGTLMLSAGFLDVLWPVFVGLGIEHVRIDPNNTAFTPLDFYDYPVSHSLLASAGWALLFGAAYYGLTRYRRGALVTAVGVLSHWILDFLTHRPDLPLLPVGGPKVGLGLWDSVPATLAIESALFLAGIWIYLNSTRAKDSKGTWGFWALIALLVTLYLGNTFGPPPPDTQFIPLMGLISLLLFAIPYWVDSHRKKS